MEEQKWWMKIVDWIIQKKLGATVIQEYVNKVLSFLDGLKTYLAGSMMILASLNGVITQIQQLLADGFQVADLDAISKTPHFETFMLGIAIITGRQAISKLAKPTISITEQK